eukprot:COSAG01_NODE_14666_length_1423_cov_12.456193_1_plen_42_part_10
MVAVQCVLAVAAVAAAVLAARRRRRLQPYAGGQACGCTRARG